MSSFVRKKDYSKVIIDDVRRLVQASREIGKPILAIPNEESIICYYGCMPFVTIYEDKWIAFSHSYIYLIAGLFDRIFIDWYWVEKTKAWIIPGTEDMRPYIYGKTLIGKWTSTLVGFPILAFIIAWIMSLF